MPDFENPFSAKPKSSVGELEQKLASQLASLSMLVGIHFTSEERDALARVIGGVLRANPWILDIPGIKKVK